MLAILPRYDRWTQAMKKQLAAILVLSTAFLALNSGFPMPGTIVRTSPNGTYQIVFESKLSRRASGLPIETVSMQVLKGSKIFLTEESFFEAEPFEAKFPKAYPTLEWINDFTFHLVEASSHQSIHDTIVVTNRSNEEIKYIALNYGRYERYLIFNLAPQAKVAVETLSQATVSDRAYVGYRGTTLSGRSFEDVNKQFQRKTPNGGLDFSIEIPNN
jgi:hypothetical protein